MAQGARVTEPTHLHRRRPLREDFQACIGRVAGQIDQDVDCVVANLPRASLVRRRPDVAKRIEGSAHAPAHGIGSIRSARVSENLEMPAIVAFDDPGEQEAGRVLVKVGGKVADAQALLLRAYSRAAQRWARQILAILPLGVLPSTAVLFGGA